MTIIKEVSEVKKRLFEICSKLDDMGFNPVRDNLASKLRAVCLEIDYFIAFSDAESDEEKEIQRLLLKGEIFDYMQGEECRAAKKIITLTNKVL